MKQTATPTKTPAHPSSQPFFGRQAGSVLASEQAEATFFGPAPFIQAKLTIGAPDDPYEREADAVAEQVVQRMSAPASEMEEKEQIQPKIQRLPLTVQRKCAACEEEEKVQKKEEDKPEEMEGPIQRKPIFESNGDEEPPPGVQPAAPMVQRKCAACEQEEQGAVQRKPSGGGEMTASADVASRISHSKGGGSPLPESVQSAMGGALGADLSGVRVHTDSRAVQLNRDLGAQAFTHGSDVYFGAGKFQPGTGEGDRLLAHELVHVGQQGGDKASDGVIQRGEAGVHHGIETEAAGVDEGLSSQTGVDQMYVGNWMRDFSQVNVPMVHDILSAIPTRIDGSSPDTIGQAGARDLSIALIRALAMLEFGPDITNSLVTEENLGVYEPEHHIDNPQGTSVEDHLVIDEASGPRRAEELASGGSVVNGGWHSVHPEINEQLGGHAIPGLQMENQRLYEVSSSGLTNHIFNSVEWAKNRLGQALIAGPTPVGRMHVGSALHVVEDYFSHSNFIEVCLNSEIDRAVTAQHEGQIPNLPSTFIRLLFDGGASSAQGSYVDTLYDTKTPEGRQAITTGTFGALDTRVSIAHLVLPRMPALVEAINRKTDEMMHFIMSEESPFWEEMQERLQGEREGLAFLEIANALDQHVQAPVYGIEFTYGQVPGFDIRYPNGFNTTLEYKGIKQAYNHYAAIYRQIKTMIDTIREVKDQIDRLLIFPFLVSALDALIKQIQDWIKQKVEELRELIKVRMTQFAMNLIESITGINIPEQKRKTIGDAADWAMQQVEGMEHRTSLQSRLAGGETGGFRQARESRGDATADIDQEISNVYGVDEQGNPIRPLPPSHSELSKDHPPYTDSIASHDLRLTFERRSYNVEFGGQQMQLEIVQPFQEDTEHEVAEGSLFFELHRQLALEADRQILAKLHEFWSVHPGAGANSERINSRPTLNSAEIGAQALGQQALEQQRSSQEGRQHSTGVELGIAGAPELFALIDLFISHPDDSSWWQPIVQNYVSLHEAEVVAHIRSRNETRQHRRP